MESEMVKELHKEKDVDYGFYRELVDKARQSIKECQVPENAKKADREQYFISDEEVDWFISGVPWLLESDELPF